MKCDKILPISLTMKKYRENNPEIYLEAGTRNLVKVVPFVEIPINAPINNLTNAVLIGKKTKNGFKFAQNKKVQYTPSSKPKFAENIMIELTKIKKGDAILIGKPNIIKMSPPKEIADYESFLVESIDGKGKDMSVCLMKAKPSK
jgi:hypothetical protein